MRGPSRALARRYARALLEVVLENKGDAQALRQELLGIADLLLGNPELARVLQHPAVAVVRKRKVLAALWKKVHPEPLLERLVDLLVGADRVTLLPGIAEAYAELWNEHRGVVAAEALSAVALTKAQRDTLAGALQKAAGRAVELTARAAPEVLGGLLVRMGGKTYDGTVRGRLQALRESLVQGR